MTVHQRRVATIWALLAAFTITVYALLALAIQAAYRAV